MYGVGALFKIISRRNIDHSENEKKNQNFKISPTNAILTATKVSTKLYLKYTIFYNNQ